MHNHDIHQKIEEVLKYEIFSLCFLYQPNYSVYDAQSL